MQQLNVVSISKTLRLDNMEAVEISFISSILESMFYDTL